MRTMISRSLAVTLAVAVAPFLFGAQPVSINLSVEPTHTIPGIGVSVHVTVENTSGEGILLPKKLLLRVTPDAGEPFIAEFGLSGEHRFSMAEVPGGEAALHIGAHSTRAFAINAHDLYGNGWSIDPRMNVPGTYRLQLLLVDPFKETMIFHTPAIRIESVVGPALASGEAVMTVETPKGDDAVLWKLLSEPSGRRVEPWSIAFVGFRERSDFAKEAMEHYPESHYAPYVVGDAISLPQARQLADAKRVVEAQPESGIRDYAQLFVARLERIVAGSEIRSNMKRAIELTDQARADYLAIERGSSSSELRETSRVEREKLPTVEELQLRAHPQPQPEQ
jgi:hypothetical protein